MKSRLIDYLNTSNRMKWYNLPKWDHWEELATYLVMYPDDWCLQRKCWHVIHGDDIPCCPTCGSATQWKVPGRDKGYSRYCSEKCAATNTQTLEKRKATNRDRYGDEFAQRTPEVRDKIEKTLVERYGVTNPGQLNAREIPPPICAHCGATGTHFSEVTWQWRCVEQISDCPGYGRKISEALRGKKREGVFHENSNHVCDYGCGQAAHYELMTSGYDNSKWCCSPYYQECPSAKTHRSEIMIEKYKDDGVRQQFSTKMMATRRQVYGENCMRTGGSVFIKARRTMLDRYGVEHFAHTDAFRTMIRSDAWWDATRKGCYRNKDYVLPSGKVIKVQGYEDWACDDLLMHYQEQLLYFGKDVPSFRYNYMGRERLYHPDIYVPSEKLIIEVKSVFTFGDSFPRNNAKREAVIGNGYAFQYMIYDSNKHRFTEDEAHIEYNRYKATKAT